MQAKGPTPGHQSNSTHSSAESGRPDFPAHPQLFPLGLVLATPGALDFMAARGMAAAAVLSRHQTGDWGDLCDEDQAANARALQDGSRIFSAYTFPAGKLWVITEYDRSSTTILLPEEY